MKYWIQRQAPAGNFVDHLGVSDLGYALEMLAAYRKSGVAIDAVYQLVQRNDVVIDGMVKSENGERMARLEGSSSPLGVDGS